MSPHARPQKLTLPPLVLPSCRPFTPFMRCLRPGSVMPVISPRSRPCPHHQHYAKKAPISQHCSALMPCIQVCLVCQWHALAAVDKPRLLERQEHLFVALLHAVRQIGHPAHSAVGSGSPFLSLFAGGMHMETCMWLMQAFAS